MCSKYQQIWIYGRRSSSSFQPLRLEEKLTDFLICSSVHQTRQTDLEAEFLPLTVQVLHLLLQHQHVVGDDVLGKIRLHGAQLRQALSPVLQTVLVLLHTITEQPSQQTVRDPLHSSLSHSYSLMSLSGRPLSLSLLSLSLFSLFLPAQKGLRATGCRPRLGEGWLWRWRGGVEDKGCDGSETMSWVQPNLFQTLLSVWFPPNSNGLKEAALFNCGRTSFSWSWSSLLQLCVGYKGSIICLYIWTHMIQYEHLSQHSEEHLHTADAIEKLHDTELTHQTKVL